MKETKISHNKKKGKHYFLFIFSMFFLLLFLSGCFILFDIMDSLFVYVGLLLGIPLFEPGEDYW